jgi:hypothetical protein
VTSESSGAHRGGYSGRPAHGLRLEIVRDDDASLQAAVVYRGYAHLPDRSVALECTARTEGVDVALDARAGLDDGDRRSLEKHVAALVRAATRSELANGDPLPQRIARWRAWTAGET